MINKIIPGAKFHHLAISSPCFGKSIEFYEKLGFTINSTWGEGEKRCALMDIGDGNFFEIFANGTTDPETNSKFMHVAIGTSDTDAAFNAAVGAGAKVWKEPYNHVIPATPTPLPVRLAFVYGPGGELIEFFNNQI